MTAKEWLQVMERAADYNPQMTPLIKKYGELLIAERMPTEECFLSPIKEEREWQEYCLHQLYTQYPNICQWQLMNGLIYMTAKANNTYLPTMDEFRSRMEEKK